MPELNKCDGLDFLDAEGFDTLTVTNMGDGVFCLSQIDAEDNLHNVVINEDIAAQLIPLLIRYLG